MYYVLQPTVFLIAINTFIVTYQLLFYNSAHEPRDLYSYIVYEIWCSLIKKHHKYIFIVP